VRLPGLLWAPLMLVCVLVEPHLASFPGRPAPDVTACALLWLGLRRGPACALAAAAGLALCRSLLLPGTLAFHLWLALAFLLALQVLRSVFVEEHPIFLVLVSILFAWWAGRVPSWVLGPGVASVFERSVPGLLLTGALAPLPFLLGVGSPVRSEALRERREHGTPR